MTAERFTSPGTPCLAYEDLGNSEAAPVVLLPGAGGSRAHWFRVAPALAANNRVLVLDPRGHGESEHAGTYRVQDYCDDLEPFVEQVAGGPVAPVGHSGGGVVAAHFAATRPRLVRGVFLEDPPLLWDWRQWDEGDGAAVTLMGELARALQRVSSTVAEAEAALAQVPSATQGESMAGQIERIGGTQMVHAFAEAWLACDPGLYGPLGEIAAVYDARRPMTCPVHLLRADPAAGPPPLGACFLPEHEDEFLRTHPRSAVTFVEGASHAIHFERAELFLDLAARFLASTSQEA